MGEKPKRCWYPILMIVMCIRLILQASISFRAVPKTIYTIFSHFPSVESQSIPSNKTIGRWLTRLGLHKLNSPKEQGEDWALIVDNSIQVGEEKCLLILGVRLSKLKGKPLEFADVEVLAIELHKNADQHSICRSLEKAQRKVGKVAMVCADDGPDLRGGIKLFCKKYGVGRMYDTIHKIGTILKRYLENDHKWQAFVQAATQAKKKMQLTPSAHLMPPNQRTKSRFLNTEILAQWAVNALIVLDNPCHPDQKLLAKYCSWLVEYRGLIEQLKQLDLINKCVRQHIRIHGISSNTGEQIEAFLEQVTKDIPFNGTACQCAGSLIDFFIEQSREVPVNQIWIGSSEIIESLFGKFKCLEQSQHKSGFTSLVLAMAACTGRIDAQIVEEAITATTTKDVEKWAETHVGATLLAKRRRAFGKGRKYKIEKIKQKLTGVFRGKVVNF